jgi:integrase
LRKLSKDELLTLDLIDEYIRNINPDIKSRKRACTVLGALAEFAKLDYDPSPLAGKYSPKRVSPHDLPDDRTVAEIGLSIKNSSWRWVYGMMATYGMRNHEVFRIDFDLLQQGCKVVSILENTKTGSRRVWACYPEWFEQFDLSNLQLPNVDLNCANERVGRSVTKYFKNIGIPFSPYNLRHCWAVRTIEFGLPLSRWGTATRCIARFIAVVSYVRTWTFWWGGSAAPPKCPNRYGYRHTTIGSRMKFIRELTSR